MTVGKSRAKVYVETDTKVTFKDVAGVDDAKFELQEIVFFLKNPKSFGRLGARAPKGTPPRRPARNWQDTAFLRGRW
jgi:cell division protease FtsH